MQVDVIDSATDLERLEGDWRAVYAADPEAQYFLSWPWMSQWLTTAIKQWVVLAAKSETAPARYVAFFALRPLTGFKKGAGVVDELTVACHGMSIYTGLICDPAAEVDALPVLARKLQEMHWANLSLESFAISDERFDLFHKEFARKIFKTHKLAHFEDADGKDMGLCPAIDLPGDWQTYLAERVGSSTRQKMRRFLRRTDQGDDLRITHANGDTFARDMDILLGLWGTMWDEEKGDEAREIKKVNRLMLTHCFDSDALFLPVIWRGDRPLGALAIVVDREKKSYLFKIAGRDETFQGPPPGFILHAHAIRRAIEHGMRTYDFLPGNDSYKYMFGSTDRRVRNLAISTRSGRNLHKTLEPRGLPRAVDLAKRLSQSGKLVEAERAYRQILEADASCEPALLGLVNLLQTKGDAKGAQKLMTSLLKHR